MPKALVSFKSTFIIGMIDINLIIIKLTSILFSVLDTCIYNLEMCGKN